MKDSKLIALFRSLDKKELRDLGKWLRSPFFNQRADVEQLFEYLKKNLGKEEEPLDKPVLFQALYPNETYQDAKMRHVMSFLLQQIKDYLAYQYWQSKPFEQEIATAAAMRQHSQDLLFQQTVNALTDALHSAQNRTHFRHFYNYQVNLEQYRASLKKSRIKAMNLQQVADALTVFYVCETLRINCLMIAHQRVTGYEYEPKMLAEVLDQATSPPLVALPEV
ncbi:MAG: hypothetical protein AAGD05_17580, partial [Bacteroidota bacterium]